jgi:hypothetical protein
VSIPKTAEPKEEVRLEGESSSRIKNPKTPRRKSYWFISMNGHEDEGKASEDARAQAPAPLPASPDPHWRYYQRTWTTNAVDRKGVTSYQWALAIVGLFALCIYSRQLDVMRQQLHAVATAA